MACDVELERESIALSFAGRPHSDRSRTDGRTEGEGKAGEAAAVASRAADPSDGRTDVGEHSRTDSVSRVKARREQGIWRCVLSKDGLRRSPSNLNLVFF